MLSILPCTVCGHFDEPAFLLAADLNCDGKLTAFDAQMLAEAIAQRRVLTEAQWAALKDLEVKDIVDYILARYPATE